MTRQCWGPQHPSFVGAVDTAILPVTAPACTPRHTERALPNFPGSLLLCLLSCTLLQPTIQHSVTHTQPTNLPRNRPVTLCRHAPQAPSTTSVGRQATPQQHVGRAARAPRRPGKARAKAATAAFACRAGAGLRVPPCAAARATTQPMVAQAGQRTGTPAAPPAPHRRRGSVLTGAGGTTCTSLLPSHARGPTRPLTASPSGANCWMGRGECRV